MARSKVKSSYTSRFLRYNLGKIYCDPPNLPSVHPGTAFNGCKVIIEVNENEKISTKIMTQKRLSLKTWKYQ